MNFTRDPIIETVITPREGCKLVVRNSKIQTQEFHVEALEVVSFGQALFFRSQERPKSFLVPVSDYEITESKEAKMVLKNASPDQSIKIGGGRETAPPRREAPQEASDVEQNERPAPEHQERKRDKRRRGRRGRDRGEYTPQHQQEQQPQPPRAEANEATESVEPIDAEAKEKAPTSFISKLFPPPSTLIKETIGRYKTAEPAPEDLLESQDLPETPFSEDETIDEQ